MGRAFRYQRRLAHIIVTVAEKKPVTSPAAAVEPEAPVVKKKAPKAPVKKTAAKKAPTKKVATKKKAAK
jgi:large subunit ribosomal protein L22